MKKLIYILASLLLLSCAGAGGFDEQEGRNPLSESVLQSTAEAGGEAVIQWNGFSDDVTVTLVNADGESFAVEVDVVTASGLVFFVPAELPAGVYVVKVTMSGSTSELGEIEVTASPEKPGTGEEPEPEPEPEPDPTPEPDPVPEPEIPAGPKTLTRIEYYSPYSVGSQLLRVWDITRTPSPTLRVSEYVVDSSGPTLSGYDEYASSTSSAFYLNVDGLEISNHVEMTYSLESEDKVSGADVKVFGKKNKTRYTWEYDAQHHLTAISYVHADKGRLALAELSYEGDCLTGFDGIAFNYADASLVNADGAADVVWGYRTLCKGHTDPALFIPYLMGWHGTGPSPLPTSMQLPDASGAGTVNCSFNYEFDTDGRVVSMSWKEGNSNLKVVYVYE